MKTIILTSIIGLATASMASAVTLDLSDPGSQGVTISGDVDTVSSNPVWSGMSDLGLFLAPGDSVTIDFGTSIAGTFDLIDLDNGETASLAVDGSPTASITGVSENIPNAVSALSPIMTYFTGSKITITNSSGPYAFAVTNVQIPEPSTAMLGGLGLIALFRRRR